MPAASLYNQTYTRRSLFRRQFLCQLSVCSSHIVVGADTSNAITAVTLEGLLVHGDLFRFGLLAPRLNMPRSSRLLFFTFLVILIIYSSLHIGDTDRGLPQLRLHQDQPKQDPSLDFTPAPGGLKDVHNSTLGVGRSIPQMSKYADFSIPCQFQKVFVLNLPERPDKLDAFSLTSSLTGFNADIIQGVKGKDVANKTLPSLEGLPKTQVDRDNVVGRWRAHLNFARTYASSTFTLNLHTRGSKLMMTMSTA